ncbi:methylmalonyl-CoA carboxyltransferase, partial [Streptomyces sp. NP-1717]|nr:methylmalonyl-CoA carboxyltransferase [Streptomyces sp. NP-1717]
MAMTTASVPAATGPGDLHGHVAELHVIKARAVAGPSDRATEAQHAKGKLTARERI